MLGKGVERSVARVIVAVETKIGSEGGLNIWLKIRRRLLA
jgi:hypothetical protein